LKKLKQYFQAMVSVVLLTVIFGWIDTSQVNIALKNVNYWFLVLALIIFTADRILMAFKWNLLLNVKGIKISLYNATRIYYISNFMGLVLPATVGADVVKTHLVAKKKFSIADVIASILVERLLGFLGLFLYGLVAVFLFINTLNESRVNFHEIILVLVCLTVLGVGSLIVSFNETAIRLVINGLKFVQNKRFWNRLSSKIQKLLLSYQSYKNEKFILLVFFLLTLVEIFAGIFINFFIASALNLHVPLSYFVAYIPIMMVIVRLPISFGGLGIREGGAIYFLGLVGVSQASAFSLGVIDNLLGLVGLIPGSIFYALDRSEAKIESAELEEEKILVEG
jgi:uncharacterized protein (TIRG00374 family)